MTADHPLHAVFTKDGARTYVAANLGDADLTVPVLRRHHADRAAGQDRHDRRAHLVGRRPGLTSS